MAGTSEGAKKAAETRKEHDPQAFEKMGQKGGHSSHGGQQSARSASGSRSSQSSGSRSKQDKE